VDSPEFEASVQALIDKQGSEDFILGALSEFQTQYVDEVPPNAYEYVLGRCVALYEEESL
jgi:hypothetical protein